MEAPRFRTVLQSGHSAEEKAVMLAMGTPDDRRFEMLFDLGCIPTILAALLAEAGKLTAKLPEKDRPPQQVIYARNVRAALGANGDLAMLFTLEGGAEITLHFPKDEEIDVVQSSLEIAEMIDSTKH
jgi:hypothetical protein